MKKPTIFLLGSAAVVVLAGPLKWLAREAAVGFVRAKRGAGRTFASVREDLQDIEAEVDSREAARKSDTSVS